MAFPKPVIIGNTKVIKDIVRLTREVSDLDLTVLITGESGVGKELIARSLHYYSHRRELPFIKVNCAAIPADLLESELFGYEKGAFTGASRSKIGKFELAKEGTIFLDEIGEIALSLQAKLLQVLQDGTFYRIGGHQEIQSKARVVAATNKNLEAEMVSGNFREDLFYRLSTICVELPPLRERKEDIIALLAYFMEEFEKKYGEPKIPLDDEMKKLLMGYHWPGNIREMYNYVQRMFVLENADMIKKDLLARTPKKQDYLSSLEGDLGEIEEDFQAHVKKNGLTSLKEIKSSITKKVEKLVIERVLDGTNWNRKETARILKISYRALLYKMKEMEIYPPKNR